MTASGFCGKAGGKDGKVDRKVLEAGGKDRKASRLCVEDCRTSDKASGKDGNAFGIDVKVI